MKIEQLTFQASLLLLALSLFGLTTISSCTHDDEIEVQIDPGSFYGTDALKIADGWNFDKTHSSVRWETVYLGSSALLTGRFNSFGITEFEFDADDPANISLEGWVTLSTVNTGEPGRDAGCLLNTFDVETKDEAKITSKAVELDGEGGYLVKCDLDFHGNVDEVIMKLTYAGMTRFDENSGLNGAPFTVAGFTGEFEFSAKSNFGIQSGNIADRILVRINTQFKKPG